MSEKIKVCLIGCGRAGMIHARDYAHHIEDAELIAFCDPNEENLRLANEEIPVKYTYTDYNEVMKNDEIDAVVVVTPTKFHKEITVLAANAKKHVFCEKPMALKKEECQEMIDACEKNNVKLQIGFMRRFDQSFKRAKELLDAGEIGNIAMIKSNTYGPSQPPAWQYDVFTNCGPIGEVNAHDIDTIRWYANSEITRVYAVGNNTRSPEKAEEYPEYYDSCVASFEFENGIIATVTGAQYVKYGYDSRTEVLGSKGILKVGNQETNKVELISKEHGIQKDSMDSWRTLFREAYIAEDAAFIESIINDTEPKVTGRDGMINLIVVDHALQSILTGKPVDIKY